MITTASVAEDAPSAFGWVFRVLSSGMTTLALVALVRPAFVKWTLSAPMQLLMDAYNTTIQVLLGWTEPYLSAAVAWFNGLVGWHVALSPIWRDAFVITTLVLTALISGERLSTQRWLLLTCLGALGALVSAVLLGVILGGTTYGLMYVVVWFLPFAMAMLITGGEDNLYIETGWALLWFVIACGVVAYLKGTDLSLIHI